MIRQNFNRFSHQSSLVRPGLAQNEFLNSVLKHTTASKTKGRGVQQLFILINLPTSTTNLLFLRELSSDWRYSELSYPFPLKWNEVWCISTPIYLQGISVIIRDIIKITEIAAMTKTSITEPRLQVFHLDNMFWGNYDREYKDLKMYSSFLLTSSHI